MNNYWKEIWQKKGESVETDLKTLDGYENTEIDSEYVSKQITKILNINPESKVLEVGCGAGLIAQHLNCDYYGVDYSIPLLKKHTQILGNKVAYSEANNLIFKDKFFDYSFSFSVFQYFEDKKYVKMVIEEMFRVTKKRIFIGDLPLKSHRKEHLLFKKEEFIGLISEGFYNKDRFNILMDVKY